MKYGKYFLVTLVVIIIDQVVKLWVHFGMDLHEEIPVFGDWFKLHYTENEGMAFGWEIAGEYGKLILTLFRIIAMVVIAWYLYYLAKKNVHQGLLWCMALILGGAIGNVIDSTFYGVFLNNHPYDAPTPWFYGKVVDMFYFDICNCKIPEWIPESLGGGSRYPLWPIFNIADAAIFLGVALILIFQGKYFKNINKEEQQPEQEVNSSSKN